jgi:Fur family transcriptional regulator, peroxide stress response regulator
VPPSRQAAAIEKALHQLDHPTAEEVWRHAQGTLPRLSLATVYRNLDGLVGRRQAQVRKVGEQKRYDPKTEPHAHLHCITCSELADVPLDAGLVEACRALAKKGGMAFGEVLLEVQGQCRSCRSKSTKPHR